MSPLLLGIVGDSAAGKTTLADGIVRLIGESGVATMCTDDYHRYDRAQRAELGITPLHPACNHLDILAQHLRLLAAGDPILKPVYGHEDGTFQAPEYVRPAPYMVVEGLHAFSSKAMRDCFSLKVYLDPPEDLRHRWKIKRDCAKRGYTPDQVIAELQRRESDSADFIRPQSAFADIVLRFEPPNGDLDDTRLSVRMILRPTVSHRDLTEVAEKAVADGCAAISLDLTRDAGQPADLVRISADIAPEETTYIESLLWERMDFDHHLKREDVGQFLEGNRVRHSDTLAIAQLFIAYHLLHAAAGLLDAR